MEYKTVTQKFIFYYSSWKLISQMCKMEHHPHWARIVGEFLDMHFTGRWVGCDEPIPWPPLSPDSMPLDLFLWGYVNEIFPSGCNR
jgi:hypothetical protein